MCYSNFVPNMLCFSDIELFIERSRLLVVTARAFVAVNLLIERFEMSVYYYYYYYSKNVVTLKSWLQVTQGH